MAIIKVKHPDLYQSWLRYYLHNEPMMPDYQRRTYAFIKSQCGEKPYGNW